MIGILFLCSFYGIVVAVITAVSPAWGLGLSIAACWFLSIQVRTVDAAQSADKAARAIRTIFTRRFFDNKTSVSNEEQSL